MSITYTNFSEASSVADERNDLTKNVSISAIPTITNIYPEIDGMPRSVKNFNTDFRLQGYNFNTVYAVYISAAGLPIGRKTGNESGSIYAHTQIDDLSGLSAFDLFGSLSSLSAYYPAFTGRKLPDSEFHITNKNLMNITFSAANNTGRAEIILVNEAGYTTLERSKPLTLSAFHPQLSARTINVVE